MPAAIASAAPSPPRQRKPKPSGIAVAAQATIVAPPVTSHATTQASDGGGLQPAFTDEPVSHAKSVNAARCPSKKGQAEGLGHFPRPPQVLLRRRAPPRTRRPPQPAKTLRIAWDSASKAAHHGWSEPVPAMNSNRTLSLSTSANNSTAKPAQRRTGNAGATGVSQESSRSSSKTRTPAKKVRSCAFVKVILGLGATGPPALEGQEVGKAALAEPAAPDSDLDGALGGKFDAHLPRRLDVPRDADCRRPAPRRPPFDRPRLRPDDRRPPDAPGTGENTAGRAGYVDRLFQIRDGRAGLAQHQIDDRARVQQTELRPGQLDGAVDQGLGLGSPALLQRQQHGQIVQGTGLERTLADGDPVQFFRVADTALKVPHHGQMEQECRGLGVLLDAASSHLLTR